MFIKPFYTAITALLFTVIIAGCSSPTQYDYNDAIDFSGFHSFSQQSVNNDHPLLQQRVDAALTTQLSAKQLTPAAADAADIDVRYTIATQTKQNKSSVSIGLGSFGSSGGVGGSVAIPVNSEGPKVVAIQLDIYQRSTDKLIWRSSEKYNDDGGDNADKRTAQINDTIAKMLANYPPQQQ
ncbi:hypothetical protein SIN8267_01555 [Sinobacterium norvegicum]|uniref:DUF4136 domain-containing protein n=1 Tax=Sinobacterium norvegicum TaxID=1641715 RepID=A0ABN8EJV3_9GAMM|nr:DUF4136 domain-containing protein [Sinobacterium norvegicum]CAH0991449.1 hypothetical protein SIN8267_01555 [Sinobacterium norvegicum]